MLSCCYHAALVGSNAEHCFKAAIATNFKKLKTAFPIFSFNTRSLHALLKYIGQGFCDTTVQCASRSINVTRSNWVHLTGSFSSHLSLNSCTYMYSHFKISVIPLHGVLHFNLNVADSRKRVWSTTCTLFPLIQ